MKQKDLVLTYLIEHESIIPAKVGGKAYGDGFFGSEVTRVCRQMRADGILDSVRDGKFTKFYFRNN